MKKILFLIIMIALSIDTYSQDRKQNIYVEILGASSTIGIHYDTRFNDCTNWGVRAGLAYTYSGIHDYIENLKGKTSGITFPIGINYVSSILNSNIHYEIGLGISIGYYESKKFIDYESREYVKIQRKIGDFAFIDLGLRYESDSGWVVRIGANGSSGIDLFNIVPITRIEDSTYPYISIGFMF